MLTVTRMDLDGPTSPSALVTKILKAEPGLALPIPIEEIARQLDILEIQDLDADGFVGGLITDESRSDGYILVKRHMMEARRRFTIGHELGHFLMRHHKGTETGFTCSAVDMQRSSRKAEMPAAVRWEVEANEFSSLLLMPPPLWRREMADFRDPNLGQVLELSKRFGVSKEAAARTYAAYHDEAVAVVLTKDGKFDRAYYNRVRFPKVGMQRGMAIPQSSVFHRVKSVLGQPSEIVSAKAESWLESDWGKPLPELSEQILFRQNGYAFIMLWAEPEPEDEYDPDVDRTAKQRLADRQSRYTR